MAEEYAADGLAPRSERVPVEQWTMLQFLHPPVPNPLHAPDDLDEWVASFVAASDSPSQMRPAPAPTGLPELDAQVQYLRDVWSEERCIAASAAMGGDTWKLGNTTDWRLWIEDDQGRRVASLPTRLGEGDVSVGEHIERQDPHAVLADLDAKEQLLAFLRPTEMYEAAVRILLQRYAQNGDFPEAWRLPAAPADRTGS
ncbi:DUF6221 family protein [Streptomyces sp. MBT33]|uniref:DUF6221 family protein n=1 Tax=Streptomyces sp. MBT33 TaxID=1488363 RepID=UPI00190A3676|nr:DUF6221 family protein [Streptomyces sp. MBT33]MBK3639506.1 hypothetical protein [Streptomyces sp. MBT33]